MIAHGGAAANSNGELLHRFRDLAGYRRSGGQVADRRAFAVGSPPVHRYCGRQAPTRSCAGS